MHIIKLSATDSTNSYLRNLCHTDTVKDYTIVVSDHQTKGRGQIGSAWASEKGKNLTFSVFKELKAFSIEHPFYISIITSLAIETALKSINIPDLKIKWPNDIMSGNKKICGILIENVIKTNSLNSSILGIGLNVNQTQFGDLSNASSLKLITGMHYNLVDILNQIIVELKKYFNLLELGEFKSIKNAYELRLFRINKPSTFKNPDGSLFSGYIKGISNSGKINLLIENNVIEEFDLKEVQLLF